jgi:hypothetical protein
LGSRLGIGIDDRIWGGTTPVPTPTPTPASPGDITTGLIVHYPFDETSGTTAADSATTDGTQNGTLQGGVTTGAPGKINTAFSFDGTDDYVSTADIDLTAKTIAAWVYIGSGTNKFHNIVSKRVAFADNPGSLDLDFTSGNFRVVYGWNQAAHRTGVNTIPENSWTHIAVTHLPGTSAPIFYINGQQTAASSWFGGTPGNYLNNAVWRIGSSPEGGSETAGQIDDVRIYNRALTPQDIQTLYTLDSATPTPTPTGPTACHSLDNTQPVPQGFAASFNPFTAQKELLLTAQCNATNTTVTLGNGNLGSPTNWDGRMWVWSNGYQLLNNTWQATTYTCSGEQIAVTGGSWCRAQATGTIDAQATAYLGYTCQWHSASSSYKCGCTDTSCTTSLWHVQQIQP